MSPAKKLRRKPVYFKVMSPTCHIWWFNVAGVSEQADADVKSNDTSISGIETSSLSSHGSSTSSSSTRGSRSSSTCAESGYYSNQNIYITGDYESMIESRPITIPGTGNQALRCRTSSLHASCAVSCRQLTPNDDSRRTPPQPFPHFNSSGSPHTYHSRGERSRSEGMCESECTHVVSQASEIRPPLPLKKGVKGIVCSMEQSVVQCCGHDFQMNKDPEYTDDKGAYEYFADSVYEEITSQGLPLVPDPSSISSQTSPRTNHSDGNGFDIPPIPPPRRKKRGKPNPAMINRISIYENCSYTPKSRSFSLPLIDSENHIPRRENGQKLNSFSSVRQLGREILSGDFNTSVDSCCRETRTPEELSCSEAYENTGNIDSSSTMTDLLVSSSDSQTNKGNCEHPPAVPEKPRPFRSFFSKASGNQPGGTDSVLANSEDTFAQYDNSENLYETLDIFGDGEELDPWIPQNYVSSSNIHPYSEITENLRWQLCLGDQNVVGAEESKEDKNRERCDEASGGDSVCLCQEIFRQINNDCADVDATQGKLCGPEANAEPEKRLENGVSTCQLNVEKPTSASEETLCTRYSADQDRINRDTLAQSQTFEPSLDTSEVLPRSSSEGDGVPAQKTCISLVTVV